MKTKISALIDGELDASELRAVCNLLRHDSELRRTASSYALIGDALRQEGYLATDVTGAVLGKLAGEPVVLAPQDWANASAGHRSWNRPMLAMAATLAGVSVVAWLGLTMAPQHPAVIAQAPTVQEHPFVMAVANDADMQEYLIAHQIHSGSTYLNGEAQHIRTVSLNGADSRQ